MKSRPFSIIILTALFFSGSPFALAYWALRCGGDVEQMRASFSPAVAGLALGSAIVGLGIWKVRFWGYITFLLYSVLMLAYLMYQYVMSAETSFYLNVLVSAAFSAAAGFFLQKHVSSPYFNPTLRWWEHDPRYRVQLAAKFQIDRQIQKGILLDISRGGCFAEIDKKLVVGEVIEIRMVLLKFDFTTKAKIIWASENPKGYGLMFIGMTRRHRHEIDRIITYLIDSMGDKTPAINDGVRTAI